MSKLAATALMLSATSAFADIDNAKADQLFKEALALRTVNPIQACAKFAEALTYNPQAIGTHLNVAKCDEDQGRIASAAEKYAEIIDRAREQKLDDFRKEAETRLDGLKDEVPHVTISFVDGAPEGVKVVIDDRVIKLDGKTRIAIDPGERKIVVTAPGRVNHVTTIVIARKDDKSIELPALALASANTRRTIGKITVLSGGVLLATSVAVALVARGRYNDAKDRCPADAEGTLVCSDADDLSALDSAKTLGNVGTVLGIVGLASAAVGGVLWWRSPTERRAGVTRVEVFGGNATGVALHGRF